LEIQEEQSSGEYGCPQVTSCVDTNLVLDQAKPQCILPIIFRFFSIFIIMFCLIVVIPRSKETEPKLPYMCPGSYITHMMTHHGNTYAMYDYLNRVLFPYINEPGVSKRLQSRKHWFTKCSTTSIFLTIGEAA
jgi:hypothetical protein